MEQLILQELGNQLDAIKSFQKFNSKCGKCNEASSETQNFILYLYVILNQKFIHLETTLKTFKDFKIGLKEYTLSVIDEVEICMKNVGNWKRDVLRFLSRIKIACEQETNSWNIFNQFYAEVDMFILVHVLHKEWSFLSHRWTQFKHLLGRLGTMLDLYKIERVSFVKDFKTLKSFRDNWLLHIKTHNNLHEKNLKKCLRYLSISTGEANV